MSRKRTPDDVLTGLSVRGAKIAAARLSGQSVKEIAAAEGVSERQVYRWLAKPELRTAIDQAAKEVVRSAGLVLRGGAREAARTLVRFANGELTAPAAVRLAAAAKIVEVAEERRLVDELSERIDAIESGERHSGGQE